MILKKWYWNNDVKKNDTKNNDIENNVVKATNKQTTKTTNFAIAVRLAVGKVALTNTLLDEIVVEVEPAI